MSEHKNHINSTKLNIFGTKDEKLILFFQFLPALKKAFI